VPEPAALDRALDLAVRRWLATWEQEPDDLSQLPTATLLRDALSSLGVDTGDGMVERVTPIVFGSDVEMPFVEPDTLAALGTLDARGYAMGCVTNTILLEAGIRDALSRLGLWRYFRVAVVSSEAGYRKPHASLFHAALDALGVDAAGAVFVGDNLQVDIAGAKAVGMRAVLTRQYREDLAPEGVGVTPDAVIERLGQLPDVIEKLNAG
jgi:putative hydrolase of the HAD superfamily